MKKSLKIRINKALWTIKYGDAGKTEGVPNDGICIYENKTIILNRKSSSNRLNVLAHELIHARCPDLCEETVEEIGTLIDETYVSLNDIK